MTTPGRVEESDPKVQYGGSRTRTPYVPVARRALIVEDDPFSQKYFEKILADKFPNMEITFAESYEEATQAIRESSRFDFVILDIFLKGERGGIDIYRQLRRAHMPPAIIMTSALDHEKYSELFKNDPAVPPFLKKPFAPDECVDMVEMFLFGGGKWD